MKKNSSNISIQGYEKKEENAAAKLKAGPFLMIALLLALLIGFITSCTKEKEELLWPSDPYLLPGTLQELNLARTSTAKYQDFNAAVADGYADISVVRPNMGYHFLRAQLLDTVFNPDKPELLVYNKEMNGKFKLVALEYAVPISLRPNEAPQGFTGNADVWKYDTEFGLWLLHAWVWEYNPAGVFKPMNPAVHVH